MRCRRRRPPALTRGHDALQRRLPGSLGARAGLSLVELVIAAGIIAVLLLASAAAMGESVESTETSKRLVRGAVFLESVQEDLAALSASELLAMNGQSVHSSEDWNDAAYRVEISVFYAAVELLQVELALVDQNAARVMATVHSMRADV